MRFLSNFYRDGHGLESNDSAMWRSTTILCVRRGGETIIGGDGQVSFGNNIIKSTSTKLRRLRGDKAICGFAGGAADGIALLERLEEKLGHYQDDLLKACVELSRDWRTDKYLRRLEAMIIVADNRNILTLTGNGDVLEAEDDIASIGSGGLFALAAARAMQKNTKLGAHDIVVKSIQIAADLCVYTNSNIKVEKMSQ